MGKIRLGILALPGHPAYLRQLYEGLEAEWFDVLLIAPPGDPFPQWTQEILAVSSTGSPTPGTVRRVQTLIPERDVWDVHGFRALTLAVRAGIRRAPAVYTRTDDALPVALGRQEARALRQVDHVVDLGTTPLSAQIRATRITIEGHHEPDPASALAARPHTAPFAVLWAPVPPNPALVAASRAAMQHLPLVAAGPFAPPELPTVADEQALRSAQVILVPVDALGPEQVHRAMTSGAAVLFPKVESVVGRVRCPVEALMVDPADAAVWRETAHALDADAELRQDLAHGAARWAFLESAAGQVRIVQGLYAGILVRRTGRCPVCP